jgi:hypothetical protein
MDHLQNSNFLQVNWTAKYRPVVTTVFERTRHFVITALFWAITQRVLVIHCDVSGRPIGPIFRGKESKIGPTGRPETSEVRNYHSTLSNNP